MMDKTTKNQPNSNTFEITDTWLAGVDLQDERYYTISEVSTLCNGVKPHVLRYWESQFKTLNPLRRNERRYYKRADIVTIREIYNLVHYNRYTVAGAKKLLDKKTVVKKTATTYTSKATILSAIASLEAIDEALVA